MKYYCSVENHGEPTNYVARQHSQLQGPRPAALTVTKNSKKITAKKKRNPENPVIVYLISPKVIHVQPEEFMALVQRLTGNHQAPDKVNNIAKSQSCSTSSISGLSQQGDLYFMESSQQKVISRRADYADVPFGVPTTTN
ncbi:VQ motif-containing protein 8, chloroplastic-like [Argentina anserina]|uniref:VQ motif-containing protein 8, chloroplastic-like n=1 Tax=Argentina anserina TaxID=57926 RepID=UPI00217661AC|nr:VQ motif-containing protein 8, chloroplastic-like [Potentilla anserina]